MAGFVCCVGGCRGSRDGLCRKMQGRVTVVVRVKVVVKGLAGGEASSRDR